MVSNGFHLSFHGNGFHGWKPLPLVSMHGNHFRPVWLPISENGFHESLCTFYTPKIGNHRRVL